jgi:hypothetical protein
LKRPAIWLQHQREIRALRKSDFFDPAWYLAQYPDVTQQGVDPLIHYVEKGASERRNPSASFDTDWYVTTYPNVLHSSINPLVHFVTFGSIEGRLPKPPADSGNDEEDCEDIQSIKSSEWFDGDWYTSEYPDVAGDGCDPAEHLLLYKASEGRNPSPRFDTKWYLATSTSALHSSWPSGRKVTVPAYTKLTRN